MQKTAFFEKYAKNDQNFFKMGRTKKFLQVRRLVQWGYNFIYRYYPGMRVIVFFIAHKSFLCGQNGKNGFGILGKKGHFWAKMT